MAKPEVCRRLTGPSGHLCGLGVTPDLAQCCGVAPAPETEGGKSPCLSYHPARSQLRT